MSDIPAAPSGALVYAHPQGKTIHVMPDGSMICYKPDGKRGTSSATPEKLAAGHGGWELQETPTDARLEGDRRRNAAEEALTVAGRVNMERLATAPTAYGLAPQLALEAEIDILETVVTGTGYVLEQKLDGDRVMLDTTNGRLVPRTRDGRLYSKGLPNALRKFAVDDGLPLNVVIDGELVGSTYWAFDLPVSGEEMVGQPLYVRRAALVALRDSGALGPIKVVPQANTMDLKHDLARIAITEGYEGVMAKIMDSRYKPGGRTRDWLKIKFTKTADVVVMPKKKDDGHNSAAYGVYDGDRLVEVGKASLNGKEKRYAIVEDDVLEVKYLYVGANGRLYQPRILRKRSDKRPEECTIDQLHHVNKEVLEAIW